MADAHSGAAGTGEAVRIAAWSGPRNLSTAMMRAWENRPDCVVMDEPLYAASLAATGGDHPMRDEIIAAGPAEFDAAIAACLAPLPDGATISYQKHMAHHLLPDVDRAWLQDMINIVLIRDPRRVLASYTKVWSDVSADAIGLPQQVELAERAAVIVDSADFLTDPGRYLDAICERVGVACDDEIRAAMTSWPSGRRASDGVWAPAWYSAVEASTGFGPAPTTPPAALSGPLEAVALECDPIYAELRAERLVLEP